MRVRGDPQWTMRRRVVIATLSSCLGLSLTAIFKDAATAQAVVPSMALLASGVVGSYVFGAAWERVKGIPSGNIVTHDGEENAA